MQAFLPIGAAVEGGVEKEKQTAPPAAKRRETPFLPFK